MIENTDYKTEYNAKNNIDKNIDKNTDKKIDQCSVTNTECRLGCGACCIAPSISSAIPGMPDGKPAGVRCIQLSEDNLCKLFGSEQRPAVCSSLRPSPEMCKETNKEAMSYLEELERETASDN